MPELDLLSFDVDIVEQAVHDFVSAVSRFFPLDRLRLLRVLFSVLSHL